MASTFKDYRNLKNGEHGPSYLPVKWGMKGDGDMRITRGMRMMNRIKKKWIVRRITVGNSPVRIKIKYYFEEFLSIAVS